MAEMIHAKDLRAGHTIIWNKDLYLVLDNTFNKTAMRSGIVKCKVKNLRTGAITNEEFTGEKVEQAPVEKKKMAFMYADGNTLNFMDNETYEQVSVPSTRLKWEKNFIGEGTEVLVASYEGQIIDVSLPDLVVLEVAHAEDAVQGNSVQNAQKKATLVSGYVLDVPQFINTGDKIRVRTSDGSYVERANK